MLVDAILRALDSADQAPTLVPEMTDEIAPESQANVAANEEVQPVT
jgi:hypothetical protein